MKSAVDRYLATMQPGSQRAGAEALSALYRGGGKSGDSIDLAAYLATRLPATAAATDAVFAEIWRLRPAFNPQSALDAGAGPGTASWAALATWPDIASLTMIDVHQGFLEMAKALASQSGAGALVSAKVERTDLCHLTGRNTYDLVVAAYSLAEIPAKSLPVAIDSLWKSAADTLVLIEPGTPAGFERLRAARIQLIAKGAHMVAPCPHQQVCPIASPDWCHFPVRLPRSRAHMHAKAAKVPFEDEKYAYLAVSRSPGPLPSARIIRPTKSSKVGIGLTLCTSDGLNHTMIESRNKNIYRDARKLVWGNAFNPSEDHMTRKLISSGSKFEAEIGYSRAVVDGEWMFVSGTTGFNYQTMAISDGVAEQAEQTLLNIKEAMAKAGFELEDIVRVHHILPNAADFPACWPIFQKYLGKIRPAATMFVAGLADPRMKIEIEVTARKRRP